jgi:hypothetical protein
VYPTTFVEIGIFALFVAPGIMYSTVRVALVGIRAVDFSVGTRVLEALFVSVLLDSLYLLFFYPFIEHVVQSPAKALLHLAYWQILLAIFLLVLLPGLVAAAFGLKPRLSAPDAGTAEGKAFAARQAARRKKAIARSKRRHWYLANGYRATPVAWDHKALNMPRGQFVRVRVESGTYFGGWYSTRSYMSTNPHGRDLYIEEQWRLRPDGSFDGPIVDGAGIWLSITETCVVDWLEAPKQPQQQERTA